VDLSNNIIKENGHPVGYIEETPATLGDRLQELLYRLLAMADKCVLLLLRKASVAAIRRCVPGHWIWDFAVRLTPVGGTDYGFRRQERVAAAIDSPMH
jgi:hypothetical protein